MTFIPSTKFNVLHIFLPTAVATDIAQCTIVLLVQFIHYQVDVQKMVLESRHCLDIPTNISFPDLLKQQAQQYAHRLALIDDATSKSYTYRQLLEQIEECSRGLWNSGFRPGDKMALFLPNCIEYPVIFFAVLALGGTCVPLNYTYTKYELRTFLEDSETTFITTTSNLIETVKDVLKYCTIKEVVIVGSETDDLVNYTTFDSLLKQKDGGVKSAPKINIKPQQVLATLCYSSGTTGKPKACMHTHYSYVASAHALWHESVRSCLPGMDITIAALPLYHMYGQLEYLAHSFMLGTTLVVLSKFHLERYLQLASQYRATVLHTVPPVLIQLVRSSLTPKYDLSSLRCIVSSAAPTPKPIIDQLAQILPNASFSQGFGMTEIMFTALSAPDTIWLKNSCGELLPNCRAKVVDIESGRELGPNEDGEIRFQSPTITTGYWKRSDATKEAFDSDFWFKTGDVGHYDEKGHIFIKERFKDILKYKGFQVSPAELESVLLQHPKVADVAVIGVPDPAAGDLPRAYIVKKTSTDVSAQEISAFIKERLAPFKQLRGGVAFVEEIPKSISGKILRRQLLEELKLTQHPTTLSKL